MPIINKVGVGSVLDQVPPFRVQIMGTALGLRDTVVVSEALKLERPAYLIRSPSLK